MVTGISLSSVPSYEVLYSREHPIGACAKGKCTEQFTLVIGNTGTRAQDRVTVELNRSALTDLVIPLAVLNFGKSRRPIEISEGESTTSVVVRDLKPGQRAHLRLMFVHDQGQGLSWEDLLKSVDASSGPVRPGAPDEVTLGRVLVGAASMF